MRERRTKQGEEAAGGNARRARECNAANDVLWRSGATPLPLLLKSPLTA
jgi:hypothetical protein